MAAPQIYLGGKRGFGTGVQPPGPQIYTPQPGNGVSWSGGQPPLPQTQQQVPVAPPQQQTNTRPPFNSGNNRPPTTPPITPGPQQPATPNVPVPPITPPGGVPGAPVAPAPIQEWYGRMMPGMAPIPIMMGGGGAPTPSNPNLNNPAPNPSAPPVPVQQNPLPAPNASGAAKLARNTGFTADGGYVHNAAPGTQLYSLNQYQAMSQGQQQQTALPTTSSSRDSSQQSIRDLNGDRKITRDEIAQQNGYQTNNPGQTVDISQEDYNYYTSMTPNVDANGMHPQELRVNQNGIVTGAGSQSGYNDDIGKPLEGAVNNWIGSNKITNQMQYFMKENQNFSPQDYTDLNRLNTELQMAYRLGKISEADAVMLQYQAWQGTSSKYGGPTTSSSRDSGALPSAATSNVGKITPPSVGDGGLLGETAPTGRTFEQIRGTEYRTEEERNWYLRKQEEMNRATHITPPALPSAGLGAQGSVPPTGGGNWSDWGENNSYNGQPFGALGRSPYQGQTQFDPTVEQWRPLVEQYFAPGDVNKALYVISKESGGRAIGQMDSSGNEVGPAWGLFQIEDNSQHAGRPAREQLLDPEFNIRMAAQMVYGG